jgi:crossover junction endodeoxyribonuclease RusA
MPRGRRKPRRKQAPKKAALVQPKAALFDFCVEGPPLSQQAEPKPKARWKKKVRKAAQAAWPARKRPFPGPLFARVTYYYERVGLDVDNMVKPILDSLEGLAYKNDKLISEAHARRRDINGSFRVRGASPRLMEAFSRAVEFLHIELFDEPDQQDVR